MGHICRTDATGAFTQSAVLKCALTKAACVRPVGGNGQHGDDLCHVACCMQGSPLAVRFTCNSGVKTSSTSEKHREAGTRALI